MCGSKDKFKSNQDWNTSTPFWINKHTQIISILGKFEGKGDRINLVEIKIE